MGQLGRILHALVSNGRWRRSLALVAVFAVGCGLLSWWQFSRREETAAANALIAQNIAAAPAPLGQVLASRTAYRPDQRWRTVVVEGVYLPQDQLLVRNRVLDDDPGFEVLTPLRLDDGSVFVLDRGWVSIGTKQDAPDSVPAAPTGRVTVEALLQADEGAIPGRSAQAGQIPSIDLAQVARQVGAPTWTGAYGMVQQEVPGAPGTPPARLKPTADLGVDEGTHLSYAVQWIIFALLAFGALAWSIRRELRDEGDEVILAADERTAARRAKRAPSDESIEDSILR